MGNFDVIETVKKRISVRSYSDRALKETLKARLRELFGVNEVGPFENPVRFRLLDLDMLNQQELRGLGTYGVIKGARIFILGAVNERRYCLEDLGFCMEKVILEATAMGLGTCWLAGTFRRSSFAARMDLSAGELLPAITPVGYPAENVSLPDRLLRFGARSHRRMAWAELFFTADGKTPLAEGEAGDYREALEAVRLGPSASNRQPWRLIKDGAGFFHLYLRENRLYNRALGKIRIQNIDMGIAMCHFALAASQRGIAGRWKELPPNAVVPGFAYIATWIAGER